MKSRVILALIFVILNGPASHAEGLSLSLEDFLAMATLSRPELEATRWKEQAANAAVDSSHAGLFPTIEAGPLVTRGEPGGSNVLSWNGNIGANMRSGQGFAGLVKYTAWDFGRTSAMIRASVAELGYAQAESERVKGELVLSLTGEYLECARNRSLLAALEPLQSETIEIRDAIDRLVRSGQRTLVEAHLARAQALEVSTQIKVVQERIRYQEQRLGLSVGRDSVTCAGLDTTTLPTMSSLISPPSSSPHPWVLSARTRGVATQERLRSAQAERNPKLQFFGNGGYFDNEELHRPWNYSVSAVLAIPLFDMRTDSEIRKSEAVHRQMESEIKGAELRLRMFSSSAAERLKVSEAQVRSLEAESYEATRGFEIARQRYRKFVGPLVELRETVRNLIRVSSSLTAARADLLNARQWVRWCGAGG